MLTEKIQHLPTQDQGAEVIVMHPDLKSWVKSPEPVIKKITERPASKMPEQPTAYLRPKKHDFL